MSSQTAQMASSIFAPDGLQPEQGPDGLKLERSAAPKGTGYKAVKLIHGKYYAKASVEPYPAPQRTLPGGGWETAREAAIHLARYLANPYPLPAKRVQRPRGQGIVRALHASFSSMPLTLSLLQRRITSAQARLKKLEKKMNMRLRTVSTLPAPAPPSPPPQEVQVTVCQHVALPEAEQPARFIVSEDTRLMVERIQAQARAQPGASPLAIMGALQREESV